MKPPTSHRRLRPTPLPLRPVPRWIDSDQAALVILGGGSALIVLAAVWVCFF